MQRTIFLSIAVAALVAAGGARASVTVFGGGDAEGCARAAIAGKSDARFEALCTNALQTEMLNPRDRAGTYVNRGVLKLRRKDWAGAMADFDEAVGIEPAMGEAYVNRGAAQVGQRQFGAGLADLNKAIGMGVEEPAKAYYDRALAYEGLDDMKAAYFDYQKAVELSPDWAAPKEQLTRFKVSRRED